MTKYISYINNHKLLKEFAKGKLVNHICKYEFAIITAFRSANDCLNKDLGT